MFRVFVGTGCLSLTGLLPASFDRRGDHPEPHSISIRMNREPVSTGFATLKPSDFLKARFPAGVPDQSDRAHLNECFCETGSYCGFRLLVKSDGYTRKKPLTGGNIHFRLSVKPAETAGVPVESYWFLFFSRFAFLSALFSFGVFAGAFFFGFLGADFSFAMIACSPVKVR